MTKREAKAEVIDLKGLLAQDADFVRAAVEALVQAALEAEMTEMSTPERKCIGRSKNASRMDDGQPPAGGFFSVRC